MSRFLVVWSGQLVSLIGSGLTSFAMGVWVYQKTGSATLFGLIATCSLAPAIVLLPIAGAIVDRWDRRKAMLVSDAGAAAITLVVAALLWADRLEVWHVAVATGLASVCKALQWPAYAASVTVLVPADQLGRANGLMSAAEALAEITAPLVAGALIGAIRVEGVLLVDLATFCASACTLAAVRFPPHRLGTQPPPNLAAEIAFGLRYLRERPGLLVLLAFFFSTNFTVLGIFQILVTPLVLDLAGPDALGVVLAAGGAGALVGSLVMSVWGGGRPRIRWVLGLTVVQALFVLLAGLAPDVRLVGAALFGVLFCFPLVGGHAQIVWQQRVAREVQGRVFAIRRMISWSSFPVAYVVSGLLADRVFEPALAPGGWLAPTVGAWLGVGPGHGIALLYLVVGCVTLGVVAAASTSRRLAECG